MESDGVRRSWWSSTESDELWRSLPDFIELRRTLSDSVGRHRTSPNSVTLCQTPSNSTRPLPNQPNSVAPSMKQFSRYCRNFYFLETRRDYTTIFLIFTVILPRFLVTKFVTMQQFLPWDPSDYVVQRSRRISAELTKSDGFQRSWTESNGVRRSWRTPNSDSVRRSSTDSVRVRVSIDSNGVPVFNRVRRRLIDSDGVWKSLKKSDGVQWFPTVFKGVWQRSTESVGVRQSPTEFNWVWWSSTESNGVR